jgi:hypothetical protein
LCCIGICCGTKWWTDIFKAEGRIKKTGTDEIGKFYGFGSGGAKEFLSGLHNVCLKVKSIR